MPVPTASPNELLVGGFLRSMSAGDLDGAFGLLCTDATWYSLSTRRHVPANEMRAAVEWVFGHALAHPIEMTVEIVTAQDDRVAVVASGRSETVHGVEYANHYHFLFEIRDHRIARIWEFNDTAHVRDVLRRGEGGSLGLSTEGS